MKNSNFAQKLVLVTILLVCASLLFLFWYKQSYLMEGKDNFEITSQSSNQKLLIAKQSSPFKDSLVVGVLNRYKSALAVVEVIDIKALINTDVADFDVLLLIHRWEANAPPDIVQSFIDKNLESKNKMVILTTSWNGLEKMENVDAISGASIIKEVPVFTDQVIKRLDRLLKYKN
ncbi:hypothetical protein M8845_07595 [Gelidibacter japonicus]|uniref:hypothetical protein n=1 Tax=Gelidibacter japonicus TaxID=1962232 RepID=UPI002022292E|nr:hypothetical protein [Gelidibacter japonicus]MCL8007286.1 hypothetical protein [Gelidibacter japonicus]